MSISYLHYQYLINFERELSEALKQEFIEKYYFSDDEHDSINIDNINW